MQGGDKERPQVERRDPAVVSGERGHEAQEGRAGDQRVLHDLRPGGEVKQRGTAQQDRGKDLSG